MKRASEEAAGGEAKKSNSGGGGMLKGMPGNTDDKVNPIPRPLKIQEITLHFTQRTWEEIGAGQLKYLPLCQTPYYMFDNAMLNQLAKFKDLWATAYFHQPQARISNLLMLQDDLINQGGTPLETTAFTQACYMMKYTPTRQLNYFQLANIENCKDGSSKILSYDLSDTTCGKDYSQLISIGNYTDFEQLAILPAKVDKYAGYNTTIKPKILDDSISTIKETYFSPSLSNTFFNQFSANMQPRENLLSSVPVIKALDQVTWARNLDKITLHKYGDEITIPITTNLEGVPLLRNEFNDITKRTAQVSIEDQETHRYYIDLIWPSRNRPYYTRSSNLSDITPFEHNKDMKNLSHTFLTMPPIRKANGALLKQRCSFMLEQSFSITYKIPESVWDKESEYDILNQADGVLLRPVLYGTTIANIVDEGAICPKGSFNCKGDNCPAGNSFIDLFDLIVDVMKTQEFFTFSEASIGKPFAFEEETELTNDVWSKDPFKSAWVEWIAMAPSTSTEYNHLSVDLLSGEPTVRLTNQSGESSTFKGNFKRKYITFNRKNITSILNNRGITCKPVGTHAEPKKYVPRDRVSEIFYC